VPLVRGDRRDTGVLNVTMVDNYKTICLGRTSLEVRISTMEMINSIDKILTAIACGFQYGGGAGIDGCKLKVIDNLINTYDTAREELKAVRDNFACEHKREVNSGG
jgi:hypothetical protein